MKLKRVNPIRSQALSLPYQPSFTYENAYGVYPYVQGLAYSYLNDIDDKHIIIDNEKDDKTLVLDYITRFDERYVRRIWAKFKEITEGYKTGVFISLTIDPKRFHSLRHAYRSLMRAWHKLHDKIKHILKEHYGMDTAPYIRVIEAQENGLPHIHIAIMGIKWLMPWKELKDLWDKKYNIGIHVDIREIYERIGVMKYMRKYLTKSLHGDKQSTNRGKFSLSTLICWALNARQFAFGGLLSLLYSKTNLRKKPLNQGKTSEKPVKNTLPRGLGVQFERGFEGGNLSPLRSDWAKYGQFRAFLRCFRAIYGRFNPNYRSNWHNLGSFHHLIIAKAGVYSGEDRLNILRAISVN